MDESSPVAALPAVLAVFDTYADLPDGGQYHFDVLIPGNDPQRALTCARQALAGLGVNTARAVIRQCRYCHSESPSAEQVAQVEQQGYAVLPIRYDSVD